MAGSKKGPRVKLGKYKGLEVVRHVRRVNEKTVEQEIIHQTRTHAVYHPSDEPAKRGSRVMLDFEGFMGGEPIDNSKMEKVMVCLGDGKLMPAAEQAIYGHRAGETFRFDFTYPEQFRIPELSGKTAQFEIKLHTVAEKSTPQPDEAFAKSLGYASLEDMKDAVRKNKAAIHEAAADRKAGAELLDKAGANCTIDIAPAAIARVASNEMEKLSLKLKRSNMSLEEHCRRNGTTPQALEAEHRKAAERRMRSVLAAKAIAEAENITVSSEEINNEYRRLAQEHSTPEADIRKALSPDAVAAAIAAHKVQVFLLANAKVKTVLDEAEAKE